MRTTAPSSIKETTQWTLSAWASLPAACGLSSQAQEFKFFSPVFKNNCTKSTSFYAVFLAFVLQHNHLHLTLWVSILYFKGTVLFLQLFEMLMQDETLKDKQIKWNKNNFSTALNRMVCMNMKHRNPLIKK